jgi:DNA-binding NtrC family response regulator
MVKTIVATTALATGGPLRSAAQVYVGPHVGAPTLPSSHAGRDDGSGGEQVPGVVMVFSRGAPHARVFSLASGALEIGRDDAGPGGIDDGRISRRHARIELVSGRCMVIDLGSQNGTFVDGERAVAHAPTPAQRVIRIGSSLLVPYADVRPFDRGVRTIDGFVRGPAMQAVLEAAARAAQSGTTLHVRGENGTGKERVAEAFHRAGPRAAKPLVAVNCAAIPHALADRLLFGTKRGAYSGADADAAGYMQEADGGTLFLDEIAELDPLVQAKLLRALESREVIPLGAAKPRKVDVAFCSATNKDLRALVAAGRLREDLYFRVASPAVTLPALRDRPEEIPPLIALALAALPSRPTPHASLVEQCLLRPWPGNVRELLAEIRTAAQAIPGADNRVTARQLPATSGTAFASAVARPPGAPNESGGSSCGPRKVSPQVDEEWRQRIENALRANAGNVTAAARDLGLYRTQLRRLLERHQIDVPASSSDDEAAD